MVIGDTLHTASTLGDYLSNAFRAQAVTFSDARVSVPAQQILNRDTIIPGGYAFAQFTEQLVAISSGFLLQHLASVAP